jgi:hypothetical protein
VAAVALAFMVSHVPDAGVTCTVGIYPSMTEAPLATTTAFVEKRLGESSRTVVFRFDPPVPVVPGESYAIGRQCPEGVSGYFSWGDPYPYGSVIAPGGSPQPTADFIFGTYSLP